MVVMELVDKEVYAEYSESHSDLRFPGATEVRTVVEEAVNTLHFGGFVHGDIRDTNLLVRIDGKLGVVLVDFDWGRLNR